MIARRLHVEHVLGESDGESKQAGRNEADYADPLRFASTCNQARDVSGYDLQLVAAIARFIALCRSNLLYPTPSTMPKCSR